MIARKRMKARKMLTHKQLLTQALVNAEVKAITGTSGSRRLTMPSQRQNS
jgi:hypothetical protein